MEVYLDNAATTRVCDEAAEMVQRVMTAEYGNPSSGHSPGRRAKAVMDTARENIAAAIGAATGDMRFTSGGTESNNWAIFSAAKSRRHKGRHIITTAVEHESVLRPLEYLAQQGFEVTRLAPDKSGYIDISNFEKALREDTVLVTVMLINNETGTALPVSDIAKLLKRKKSSALLHCDAVQAFLKTTFTVSSLGADMISLSGHKIHGPKGVGALYIRRGLNLPPLIMGGGQEGAQRSGTEALPNIAGFGEAARIGFAHMAEAVEDMRSIREYARESLKKALPEIEFIGRGDAVHILNFSLPGYKSEVLTNYLDGAGIYVSKGSACKKGARSHVLTAMGLDNKTVDGAVRVSISKYTTVEEIDYFCKTMAQVKNAVMSV